MKFNSTRDKSLAYSLDEALILGLAPDGGLFMPQAFPRYDLNSLDVSDYAAFAVAVLEPFFNESSLKSHLKNICGEAFNFKVPLQPLNNNTQMLELFHGPTLSFKDFGARFLASSLSYLSKDKKRTIMVATSGDTGSAVASAFYEMDHIDVIILFPQHKISKRQQQQISCWGKNISCYAVKGRFDDCQRMVKAAFSDERFNELNLTTANSINIGRLLPQMVYYAYSSLKHFKKTNEKINFIIPSGNFGNVTAAFLAKACGFPINHLHIACNANHVLMDYLASGIFTPHESINTLANAMDVGNPSNFERLQYLFPQFEDFKHHIHGQSVSDEEIKQAISDAYNNDHVIICPHTATAYFYRQQLAGDHTIVATAHPCKFETIIEPLIQEKIDIAPQLAWMLEQEEKYKVIDADLEQLEIS